MLSSGARKLTRDAGLLRVLSMQEYIKLGRRSEGKSDRVRRPRRGIDVKTVACIAGRRRGGGRRVIDRRILRQNQRPQWPSHLDLFLVSERDSWRAPFDPRHPRRGTPPVPRG